MAVGKTLSHIFQVCGPISTILSLLGFYVYTIYILLFFFRIIIECFLESEGGKGRFLIKMFRLQM